AALPDAAADMPVGGAGSCAGPALPLGLAIDDGRGNGFPVGLDGKRAGVLDGSGHGDVLRLGWFRFLKNTLSPAQFPHHDSERGRDHALVFKAAPWRGLPARSAPSGGRSEGGLVAGAPWDGGAG